MDPRTLEQNPNNPNQLNPSLLKPNIKTYNHSTSPFICKLDHPLLKEPTKTNQKKVLHPLFAN